MYLDHQSLYECGSLAEVQHPEVWSDAKYPEDSLLKWYCEIDSFTTTIWVNFGGKDLRTEMVGINVRPNRTHFIEMNAPPIKGRHC